MELNHTTIIIYAALCLGFTAILAGGQNEDIFKYRGEDVNLVCNFPVFIKFPNCRWLFTQHGGEERSLSNGTRYTWSCMQLSFSPSWVRIQIEFNNVTFNDSGTYTCELMTARGVDNKKEIQLTVLAKPEIKVHKTNYTAVSGTQITLECVVNANGEISTSIEWRYMVNQHWINARSSDKYFWTNQMPSLVISNVQTSDSGSYKCLATTRAGLVEGPAILLNVQSTPSIISPVHEYRTINGTNAVLEVRIDDRMQTSLSVQWEKYNEENQQWFPLENNSRLIWTYAEPSLKIATALVDDDGKYRIIGKTAYYEVASSPITLTIDVPVKIKELATRPVFIREGDNVEIRCLVDGRPKPNVTWRLANGTTSSLTNVQDNILILKSVSNLNEGNYTCIAHNSFSSDESLIYMTVSDKDLTGSPLEKYVVPGASVFVCVALIALILVVILIRRKRHKGRTDQPNLEIRSTNGQQHPSPSENIGSENNHAKLSVHRFGDMTYPQMIRKSSKRIDGDKSIRDTDASKVYMNINNRSNSNSNNYINVEMETDNTQMNKTGELNYAALNFSYNAKEENIYLGIQGPHLTQRVQKK